jgi:hypothetical protein
VEVKALAVLEGESTFDEEAVVTSGRARGISFHLFIIASDIWREDVVAVARFYIKR